MFSCATALLLLLAMATTAYCSSKEMKALKMVQIQVSQARSWVDGYVRLHGLLDKKYVALEDCVKLYGESESRLSHMLTDMNVYTTHDALTWISSVMTSHKTCLDELKAKGFPEPPQELDKNMTMMLRKALVSYAKNRGKTKEPLQETLLESNGGLLASWSSGTSNADFTVAQDGSGTHKTIIEAIDALAAMDSSRPSRPVIYVKSGVYNEKVDIGINLKNVMFVGDGIDQTIVTGNKNVIQGYSTISSATFDVSGDGFWARDMTFENTAGPSGHQAVALRVSSDLSVFYKCSFKVVFQNCDIFLRRPMDHQTNFITAQGRDDPNKPTGISIQSCQVKPAYDFDSYKDSIRSYLGRPWKQYSRTLFLKTDLDGLIDPKGWGEWNGDFALSTLYYGEYMNTGSGASTQNRVTWPGFRVLNNDDEATPFSVSQFLQGEQWIPATGVPFWSGI
ncbi:hypothetical protein GYH30_052375 [Glycine max]|nr:hypothetical protein GYH30_052375 [Glycine max]